MCFSKKEFYVWLRTLHWLHHATWLIGNPPFGHEQFTHSPRRLAIFRVLEAITRLRISKFTQQFSRSSVSPGESGAETLK
jgi:hypothetical protein